MIQSRNKSNARLFWAVTLSFFIALVLTVLPLPQWLFYFWPDWMALLVFYWALTVPERVGPWVGFAIGTLMEVLFVRKFGVLGFGMAILAFAVNRSHLQLRALSIWQQMLIVGLFVGFLKLIVGWLYGLISGFTLTTDYWYSLIGSMLIWPFVFILMHEVRRMARID